MYKKTKKYVFNKNIKYFFLQIYNNTKILKITIYCLNHLKDIITIIIINKEK